MYLLPLFLHDYRTRVLTLASYDSFKIFMGLPTTGGGPAAEQKK